MAEPRARMGEAAVLVPLYRDEAGELRLVVVRRSDRGIHAGQIVFPGGKRIRPDHTLLETALREAREEIGIDTDAVQILEHLPAVETRTTGFRINPFLARVVPPSEWHRDKREIAEILEVRIEHLARPEAHGEETRCFTGWAEPQSCPFYRIGPYKLWGATYRILKALLPRLIAEEWSV